MYSEGTKVQKVRRPGDQVSVVCALLVLNIPANDMCLLCLVWSIGACIQTPVWEKLTLL